MWPFTFTLQCQHLNHCRSARAQGCSRAAANKAAAGPPPPPGRPEEGTPAAPRRPPHPAFLSAPLPLPPLRSCSLCCPKALSWGPGGHSARSKLSTGVQLRAQPRAGPQDTRTGRNKAAAVRQQLSGWVPPPRRGPGARGTCIGFDPVTPS